MDPRHGTPYKRLEGFCVYCGGGESLTEDHVPARVFLDERHKKAAHVVEACRGCNSGASLDEEFVACLLESVVSGSTDGASLGRDSIRRTLAHSPGIGQVIERGRSLDLFGGIDWAITPEQSARVERVVVKLARGLVAHENGEARFDEPERVWIRPLPSLDDAQRDEFEGPETSGVVLNWPEVGTRALVRAVEGPEGWPWAVIQPERFRYRVDDAEVRMVVRDYLACVVAW